jgi:hypothetical protein
MSAGACWTARSARPACPGRRRNRSSGGSSSRGGRRTRSPSRRYPAASAGDSRWPSSSRRARTFSCSTSPPTGAAGREADAEARQAQAPTGEAAPPERARVGRGRDYAAGDGGRRARAAPRGGLVRCRDTRGPPPSARRATGAAFALGALVRRGSGVAARSLKRPGARWRRPLRRRLSSGGPTPGSPS